MPVCVIEKTRIQSGHHILCTLQISNQDNVQYFSSNFLTLHEVYFVSLFLIYFSLLFSSPLPLLFYLYLGAIYGTLLCFTDYCPTQSTSIYEPTRVGTSDQ